LQWSSLKGRLPDNVHLLTLEQWVAGSVLIRFEHFFEKDEDPVLSQPATVQLKVCALYCCPASLRDSRTTKRRNVSQLSVLREIGSSVDCVVSFQAFRIFVFLQALLLVCLCVYRPDY
jgi:Glycosyl hydrolases family 38 C-terminal beta sandwich domain